MYNSVELLYGIYIIANEIAASKFHRPTVHGIGAVSFTKHLTFPMMTMAKMAGCGRVINPLLYNTSHLPHDDNGQDGWLWKDAKHLSKHVHYQTLP